MELNKKYLDTTDLVFNNVVTPLGKPLNEATEIYFIIKDTPETPTQNAKILKKLSQGDVTINGLDLKVKFDLLDYNFLKVGYLYVVGLSFEFPDQNGFLEVDVYDLRFTYPVNYAGENVSDQVQEPQTLLGMLDALLITETFTATDLQTAFTVSKAKIKDNSFLSVQVEAESVLAKNGVKGFPSAGIYTADFDNGIITFDAGLPQGTPVVITYTI